VSHEHVAEIRAKYGRPGVSGRKRKGVPQTDSDGMAETSKTKRFKVCVIVNLYLTVIMVCCYMKTSTEKETIDMLLTTQIRVPLLHE